MTRLIGYGAYNLCFDRDLGLNQGKDFFQFIHDGRWPVNLVKVICFRKATLEGLPALTDTDKRTIPLYTSTGAINQLFLQNVQKLVERARPLGFTVQICIFHYHAIARDEAPENMPAVLRKPANASVCDYMKYFFRPVPAVLTEQLKLVSALVNQLRFTNNLSNVIWEVANELRVDSCGQVENQATNCSIVPWMNRIAQGIVDAAPPNSNPPILISTGTYTDSPTATVPNPIPGSANENITFNKHRPADGCLNPPFTAVRYDLHSGQWEALGDYATAMRTGIRNRFNFGYGIQNPSLIINTDGVHDNQRTAAAVQAWATEAFRNGHSFSTKGWYPPHVPPYDTGQLDALKNANNAFP